MTNFLTKSFLVYYRILSYELKEYDMLNAHLGAMRIFIQRKKIRVSHQENYLNLVKFTRKLIERNPFDHAATEHLVMEIKAERVVPEKGWLLRMLEK